MILDGTVTLSLAAYEELREVNRKAVEEVEKARKEAREARMLCRDILKRAFTAEAVSYQKMPEVKCHFVPEVVAILNEQLAQASQQTGTIYQIDMPAYTGPIEAEVTPSCFLYVKLRDTGLGTTTNATPILKEEEF